MSTHQKLSALSRLEKITHLPSIGQVIMNIKEITENPKASAADLANAILSDHQLTSRILRMANSAYYGDFSGKITTVTHAVMLMGFRAVRNIALSLVVYEGINKLFAKGGLDIKTFWSKSLASGVITKYLARCTNRSTLVEVAFIAGFMHDIGRVLLAGTFPDEYHEISRMESDITTIDKTERILLGIDHLEAGGYIAKKWNLPDALIQPIAEHNRHGLNANQPSTNVLVDMVYISELVIPQVTLSVSCETPTYVDIIQQAEHLLGINEDAMLQLPAVCRQEISEIAGELEIDIDTEFDRQAEAGNELAAIQQKLTIKEVQLAYLQSASAALLTAKKDEDILSIMCEAIFHAMQMGRVILFEYCRSDNSFSGRMGFGVGNQRDIHALSFRADQGIFGHIYKNGKPVSIVDCESPVYRDLVTKNELSELESVAIALLPIMILGDVTYILYADHPNKSDPIDDEQMRSMTSLVNQGSLTLERNLLQKKLLERI